MFATASPLNSLTLDRGVDRHRPRLYTPYFGLHRIDFGPAEPVEYQLPYGAWVSLFRENGLSVERLDETRSPARGRSSYLGRADAAFGRRWPLECIWRLRKVDGE